MGNMLCDLFSENPSDTAKVIEGGIVLKVEGNGDDPFPGPSNNGSVITQELEAKTHLMNEALEYYPQWNGVLEH